MATIKTASIEYTQNSLKNIADLESVSTNLELVSETRPDSDGGEYEVMFIKVNDENYRVPPSVLGELQEILKFKPNLESFKVSKTGEGMNTRYKVIQL